MTADGSGPVRAGPFDGGSTCQDLPPLLPQVQVPAACSPAVVAYDPDALPELVDSVESALQAGPLRLAVRTTSLISPRNKRPPGPTTLAVVVPTLNVSPPVPPVVAAARSCRSQVAASDVGLGE